MVKKRKLPEHPHTGYACAVPGCRNPGDYRAPRSRYGDGGYQYLCLDHIREFNKAWDYFDGWSRAEIEAFSHSAGYGHRPTWKIGTQPVFTDAALQDAFFRMLGEAPPKNAGRHPPRIPRKEREALDALELDPGADLPLIKSQYKKLVKKYHPDVNKGDKRSEETFKRVTAAYKLLLATYGKNHES